MLDGRPDFYFFSFELPIVIRIELIKFSITWWTESSFRKHCLQLLKVKIFYTDRWGPLFRVSFDLIIHRSFTHFAKKIYFTRISVYWSGLLEVQQLFKTSITFKCWDRWMVQHCYWWSVSVLLHLNVPGEEHLLLFDVPPECSARVRFLCWLIIQRIVSWNINETSFY